MVTCMSQHSRNRSVGERLGRGELLDQIMSGMQMAAEGSGIVVQFVNWEIKWESLCRLQNKFMPLFMRDFHRRCDDSFDGPLLAESE